MYTCTQTLVYFYLSIFLPINLYIYAYRDARTQTQAHTHRHSPTYSWTPACTHAQTWSCVRGPGARGPAVSLESETNRLRDPRPGERLACCLSGRTLQSLPLWTRSLIIVARTWYEIQQRKRAMWFLMSFVASRDSLTSRRQDGELTSCRQRKFD